MAPPLIGATGQLLATLTVVFAVSVLLPITAAALINRIHVWFARWGTGSLTSNHPSMVDLPDL
jgi:hypothetical protein